MEHSVKFIISNRFDGLGGRVLNLLVSMSLAEKLSAQLLVTWPDTWDLSAQSIHFLFDDPIANDYPKSPGGTLVGHDFIFKSNEIRRLRLIGNYDSLAASDLENFDTIAIRNVNLRKVSNFEGYGEAQLRNDIARSFGRLTLAEPINRTVADFLRKEPLLNATGVHVRRGDAANHKQDMHSRRALPLASYFDHLDKCLPERIFVATDSTEVFQEFANKYGSRIVRLGMQSPETIGFSRTDQGDLQHAFSEMVLLSKCSQIIAGPSNFSRLAALIGGSQLFLLDTGQSGAEWDRIKGNWGVE